MSLLKLTDCGLYCPRGNFYIDPWKKVKVALITHAHSDHARFGSNLYVAHKLCTPILKYRLGKQIVTEDVEWGQNIYYNGVKVSFHPAGHIIGSSQIRLEYKGQVTVASGDYKTVDDGISGAFEAIKCDTFITESTFGLPIFDWQSQDEIFAEINNWWAQNNKEGLCSVIFGYSLGKAQRILQYANREIGPVYTHGVIENTTQILREAGIPLKSSTLVSKETPKNDFKGALIIAPPSAQASPWLKKFEPYSDAIASGWMALRGARRRSSADRGFVLSDHADWKGLNAAISATCASEVLVTHGYTDIFSRWLNENGTTARELKTQYENQETQDEDQEINLLNENLQ